VIAYFYRFFLLVLLHHLYTSETTMDGLTLYPPQRYAGQVLSISLPLRLLAFRYPFRRLWLCVRRDRRMKKTYGVVVEEPENSTLAIYRSLLSHTLCFSFTSESGDK